ncbi:MAG: glucose-1-phosphate adenylyltransferase [Candidatus Omnitrophica bacterium]|nr:glucose-1-phosphate adenylyltransferase [Candidatus Omnitrophota bacterium]
MHEKSADHYRVLTIILGGGRGSRLFPLTKTRCKAAVPMGGKYRLIDIVLSNCIHSHLHHIFILAQYLGRSLQRHIIQSYRFDQFSDGFVEILSAEQTLTDFLWYEGTADAVRKNISRIEHFQTENVLILSADHLYRMDYRKMIDYHIEKGADLTVAATPVNDDEAPRMGILQVDRNDKALSMVEKPKDPGKLGTLRYRSEGQKGEKYLASMGIYIFKKKFLLEALKSGAAEDFGSQIIPEVIEKGNVFVYKFDGYWRDVGTMASFFDAHIDFTSNLPHFDFYLEHARVFTRPRFLPPAKLLDCKVSKCIIGEGSVIEGAEMIESVIGIRSMIQGSTLIRRSIVMGNDYYERLYDTGFIRPMIGKHVTIERAIIDKNTVIGDGCEIRGTEVPMNEDGTEYYIRDGIVVIPSNTTIAPGTKIIAGASKEIKVK